ncbi:phosphoglyceromutase [soil metagenome]
MSPSTLVLLRHGQSTWNRDNLFTGWYDSDLSQRGCDEAVGAGDMLAEAEIRPDVVHTSLLVRAIRTADLALDRLGRLWLPVRRTWRLTERHYGRLQGKNKLETTREFGPDQVEAWRRSYDTRPPGVDATSEHHPVNDVRYAGLTPDVLPASECLNDVVLRMLPWWHDMAVADLRTGAVVLVAAHGNSLRGLVKHLDGISDDDIAGLNIPTGIPLVYALDDDMAPIVAGGRYLDPEAAAAGAEAVKRQAG